MLRTPEQREANQAEMRLRLHPPRISRVWETWSKRMYRALLLSKALAIRRLSISDRRKYRGVLEEEARRLASHGERFCREWLRCRGL